MTQSHAGASPPLASSSRLQADRPFSEVVVELWENTEKLVRQELALAGAELDQKIGRLKSEVIVVAMGGGVLFLGLASGVAALVLLLSKVMDPFLAALLVAVALSAVGYVMVSRKKPSVDELVPERTIENVRKDIETFKEAKP